MSLRPATFELTIAAFNVFLRPRFPMFLDGQLLRSERLPAYLCDDAFDVLALSELFDDGCREALLAQLERHYPYRSKLVGEGEDSWKQTGGVMILSRWPIEHQAERLFGDTAVGTDIVANKGVVYARVVKHGRPVHVLATHLNARSYGAAARKKQLAMIRELYEEQRLEPGDPVLFAGDFNIPRGGHEVGTMLTTLDVELPRNRGHDYSYDPEVNRLANGERTHVDYVLSSRHHAGRPDLVNVTARPTCKPWRQLPFQSPCSELSDHFPVIAKLVL